MNSSDDDATDKVYLPSSDSMQLFKVWKNRRQRRAAEGAQDMQPTLTTRPTSRYLAPIDRGRANGKTISFKLVRAELQNLGMVISFDLDSREYRVNYHGGEEATAYYTNDLSDAYGTGKLMSQTKNSPPQSRVE